MFSFSGLASGIDTKQIVDQLIQIDSRPKVKLEWNSQLQNLRKSIWNDLDGKLGSLKGAADALLKSEAWDPAQANAQPGSPWKATSGDPARLTATVNGAPENGGSYQIQVLQLAQGDISKASGSLAPGGVANNETFSITQGSNTWDIELQQGDQLTDIAAKINNTDGIGVFATIEGGALKLSSLDTGSSSEFNVSSTGSTASALNFEKVQYAQNAFYRVDGAMKNSESNFNITDAIDDVSLSLNGITTTTLTIGQGEGPAGLTQQEAWENSIIDKVKSLVSSYNSVVDFVHQKTQLESKAGASNSKNGQSLSEYLAGPMARSVQMSGVSSQLRGQLMDPVSGLDAGSNMLQDIGIKSSFSIGAKEAQGRLTLDEEALRTALKEDPERVKAILYQAGDENGNGKDSGFARRVASISGELRDSVVSGAKSSADDNIKRLKDSIERAERGLDAKRTRYERMYASMEKAIGQLNTQGNWLQMQIMGMMNNR